MTGQVTSPTRYSSAAIVLHWMLAVMLLFQLGLGWRMEDLPRGDGRFAVFQLHKSIGITILLLTLARLAIRWWKPRPAPASDSAVNMALAKGVHWLLYLFMIGGPLTGWIMVSTSRLKVQTMVFGTLPWPNLPLGGAWNEPAKVAHGALAWLFVALLVLHVAGALRHHIKREDLLGRMLPARLASQGALTAGAIAALLGASLAFAAGQWLPISGGAPRPALAPTTAPEPTSTQSSSPEPLASASETPTPQASASTAAATEWIVEPGGRLTFRADYSGSPVDGAFKRWDADIRFDPQDLAQSRVRVTVDLASADTAESERDAMLKGESFFNTAAHPRAVFTANGFRARGPGRYSAAGTLSLHGVSQPVAVDFELKLDGNRATASGTARLSRTAFGVGVGEWAATDQIADGVTVNFRLRARRSD
jgi:cytochrome b561/polyisoprenoid-binding protein YceI